MFNYGLGMTQGGGMGNLGGVVGGAAGLLGNLYGGPQQGQAQPEGEEEVQQQGPMIPGIGGIAGQALGGNPFGIAGQIAGLGPKASDTMGNMGGLGGLMGGGVVGQFMDPMTVKRVY